MKDKILLVDDSKTSIENLSELLNSEGMEVFEARNGLEGIKILENNPDMKLVISDLHMPVMDGLTMCEEIRKIPKFSNLPIILITSESSADAKVRGKRSKIKAWIVKPCDPNKVLLIVKYLLQT
ncbi:MAG: response regulator [Oligoflexia bacterium]|nr:response regulator [Oligoflexia bacterium]